MSSAEQMMLAEGNVIRGTLETLLLKYLKKKGPSRNIDIAKNLGLESSSIGGTHKNYLTWSILQDLVVNKKVSYNSTTHQYTAI